MPTPRPTAFRPAATGASSAALMPIDSPRLRAAIDMRLYTPGSADGRPLAIPVVPEGLGQLATAEREQTAGFAAAALGGMIGYRPRGADQVLQAILTKAIEVLAEMIPTQSITVEAIQTLVGDQDAALLNAVGGYEAKHYKKLAQDLLTLRLQNGRLLSANGDQLDIDLLLGRNAFAVAGKTRLTIVNTQFLTSAGAADFWVAQFLLALDRWRTRNPSANLQAVVLLDEADIYLPARASHQPRRHSNRCCDCAVGGAGVHARDSKSGRLRLPLPGEHPRLGGWAGQRAGGAE